jgi:hypothetical protein
MFPVLIKFAAAAAVFWLISPKGPLGTPVRYGLRVAACIVAVAIVAYPFASFTRSEWYGALVIIPTAWVIGFVAGWAGGWLYLTLTSPRRRF